MVGKRRFLGKRLAYFVVAEIYAASRLEHLSSARVNFRLRRVVTRLTGVSWLLLSNNLDLVEIIEGSYQFLAQITSWRERKTRRLERVLFWGSGLSKNLWKRLLRWLVNF